MRLVCPNCEAQYEVDAAVIPEAGRDVQCSNCGHTWFQPPDGTAAGPEPVVPDPEPPPRPAPAPAAPPAEPKRRTLDDAVLNVLREEAERETRARIAEGSSLETQADLGLVAGAAAPTAPPSAAPAEPGPPEAVVSRAARRELLPDIEEINSTLRAASERGDEPAAKDAPQVLRLRRGEFRRGFLSTLMLALLLLVLYLFSGGIAARVPLLAPALSGYADMVDGVRLWLDQRMRSTTESLRGGDQTSG
jgi:predicted Zn finger-like uncharacterized protein